ncbi:2-oxoglutarate dehydrogenase, E2 component, dihydrolipoamide succinyltransferase [uncultured Agrococcus sp.]|uniref:2-oxoglutarate dehydrogenase, E2 component, dihydrolipoamide succinyltransferase n=1 Tax=uncultured Agrococcus sp. TaxID=382258 RepID=UPI0025D5C4E7|nr:2-oxoglutarate dehydrogenase, E2 component, dihydrolipoamide succinyltransferase [uncultured Agrococcus sp.]
MSDITLPELGESVTEGTITRWLKQVGDTVEVDEPIVEISTDKVDTEIPSPVAGTLTEILADEDDEVEVGAVIARVGEPSEASSDTQDAPEEDAEETSEAAPAEETEQEEPEEEPAQEEPTQEEAATDEPQQKAPASASGDAAADVTLPELGESVTEGTITRWLKQVGDTVEVDEPIVEISTDKVDTEIPSPVAGTLTEILADEDDEVEVGAVIARIGDDSTTAAASESAPEPEPVQEPEPEPAPDPDSEPAQESAPPEEPKQTEPEQKESEPKEEAPEAPAAPSAPKAPASSDARVYVTPIVRKLAAEKGVDLQGLQGTGVGGRIRKEDVLQASSSTPASKDVGATGRKLAAGSARITEASPLRGSTEKMSRLRKIVATRAVESMTTMAQLTTVVEVDVTRVAKLRDAVKAEFLEKTGTKLSFLPFFSLAAVEALKAHPKINSTDDGESITYPDTENLAMAVDTERGLLTPVIKNAGELDLRQYAEQIADLAARTRDNKLSPDELAGGTFTLTNTGSRGALFDTPVVFQPQRAILGVGTVVKRPVVVSGPEGDSIAVRSTVYLALSYDHRTIDGADAARYLTAVKARLEEGDFEPDLGI